MDDAFGNVGKGDTGLYGRRTVPDRIRPVADQEQALLADNRKRSRNSS